MQNRWLWVASLIAMAIASSTLTWLLAKRSADDKAVYLIGAVTITDAERLPEYQAIAGPLAAKTGGYVPLAFSEPTMIEGKRPTAGLYFIERYDSMAGVNAFIESAEFQEAKLLRDEVADVHFMLVIDAYNH